MEISSSKLLFLLDNASKILPTADVDTGKTFLYFLGIINLVILNIVKVN